MDIRTVWVTDAGYGDWALDPTSVSIWTDETGASIRDENGHAVDAIIDPGSGLAEGSDLATAVLISLFTDAEAGDDDTPTDGTANRRGWWGGSIGSKIWLRLRMKPGDDLLALVRNDISDALAWMITDGVAAQIDVTTEFTRPGMLGAQVTIYRRSGGTVALKFSRLWEAI